MLDAGPLGRLAKKQPVAEVRAWLDRLLAARVDLYIAEVADYEVRRNLLLHGATQSIERLDELKLLANYQPITTSVILTAAELWADARRKGMPTADLHELDCDVILAAQAMETGAVVATDNVKHLSRYVDAREWRLIRPA